jgi:hypothetical protein
VKEVILVFPLRLNRVRGEDGGKSVIHLAFRLLHLNVGDFDRERWNGENRFHERGAMSDDRIVEDVGKSTRMISNEVSKGGGKRESRVAKKARVELTEAIQIFSSSSDDVSSGSEFAVDGSTA